jgi:phage terminase Nu1 subunit (DNA packaging protein)
MPEKATRGTRRHLLSLADFAGLLGKHRTTVQQWIRDGMPVAKVRGGKQGAHQIELGPALEWHQARLEAQLEERLRQVESAFEERLQAKEASFEARLKALMSSPDIDAARARKTAAEADIAEMERDQKRGDLVPTVDVEERWAGMIISLRENVMAIPGVAVQSGLIPPAREVDLETACRDALTSFGQAGQDVNAAA